MASRVKKPAKGVRSKPKRAVEVAIDNCGLQPIADPWIGLRYVRTISSTPTRTPYGVEGTAVA